MENFNNSFKKIIEGLAGGNFERAGIGDGPNIDFNGNLPSGFKGSGTAGIAPGETSFIKIKIKNKKKKST